MITVIRKQGLVIMTTAFMRQDDVDKLRERLEKEVESGLVILDSGCRAMTYDMDKAIITAEEAQP